MQLQYIRLKHLLQNLPAEDRVNEQVVYVLMIYTVLLLALFLLGEGYFCVCVLVTITCSSAVDDKNQETQPLWKTTESRWYFVCISEG